jgi:hypothetical protein
MKVSLFARPHDEETFNFYDDCVSPESTILHISDDSENALQKPKHVVRSKYFPPTKILKEVQHAAKYEKLKGPEQVRRGSAMEKPKHSPLGKMLSEPEHVVKKCKSTASKRRKRHPPKQIAQTKKPEILPSKFDIFASLSSFPLANEYLTKFQQTQYLVNRRYRFSFRTKIYTYFRISNQNLQLHNLRQFSTVVSSKKNTRKNADSRQAA